MQPELSQQEFPERTLRQVAADARRALVRAGWCPERSRVDRLRCGDDVVETELEFGRQLWLFEAQAVDACHDRPNALVFGAVEYSVQFALMEAVDLGVFDSDAQRLRFVAVYQGVDSRPSWRWQILRWSVIGCFVTTMLTVLVFYLYSIANAS